MKICNENILLVNREVPTKNHGYENRDNASRQANSSHRVDLGTDRTGEFRINQEFIDEEKII